MFDPQITQIDADKWPRKGAEGTKCFKQIDADKWPPQINKGKRDLTPVK